MMQKGTGPHSEQVFFWIVVVAVGQCVVGGVVMVVLCGFAREMGMRLELVSGNAFDGDGEELLGFSMTWG